MVSKKIPLSIPKIKPKEGFGWLYYLLLNDEIVYIGQTKQVHPMARIGAHFNDKEFTHFRYELIDLLKLDEIEQRRIFYHKPKYNKAQHRPIEASKGYLRDKAAIEMFVSLMLKETNQYDEYILVAFFIANCPKRKVKGTKLKYSYTEKDITSLFSDTIKYRMVDDYANNN